jgi:uncharacterized membrane protein
MTKLLLPWLAIVVVMMALDVVWIGGIAKPLYDRGLGHLMAPQPNFVAAIAFYLLYAVGVMAFVVVPHGTQAWPVVAGWGAALGLLAYLTWDLTNMAVLRDWPLALSFIDMAWGSFATGTASVAAKLAADRLG